MERQDLRQELGFVSPRECLKGILIAVDVCESAMDRVKSDGMTYLGEEAKMSLLE